MRRRRAAISRIDMRGIVAQRPQPGMGFEPLAVGQIDGVGVEVVDGGEVVIGGERGVAEINAIGAPLRPQRVRERRQSGAKLDRPRRRQRRRRAEHDGR